MLPSDLVAPKGLRYHDAFDGFTVACSTRSASAFILIPFTAVWSGFSLAGLYGAQFSKGQFDPVMSLFGLPFVIGTVLLVWKTLMSLFGEVRVELRAGRLLYFVGIGPFGRRQSIDWNGIDSVREIIGPPVNEGERTDSIYLEGRERHVVGKALSPSHRYFVLKILEAKLKQKTA